MLGYDHNLYIFRKDLQNGDDTRLTNLPLVPTDSRKVRAVTEFPSNKFGKGIEEESKLDFHKINLSQTIMQG